MGLVSRSLQRLLAALRLRGDVGVWYHPDYSFEPLSRTSRTSFVDARRAERILGALAKEGMLRGGDLRSCEPASFQDLLRVHSDSWLDTSMRQDVLAHVFGLEPSDVPVDELLESQRRAVGGTMAAARAAVAGEVGVAFNLGGGFHHAAPEQGAGFCVYNDVAVAIEAVRAQGFAGRIAVVDLDFHQGDGTLLAFVDDPTVLTWSLHGARWCWVEAVADAGHQLPYGTGDEDYLSFLEKKLPPALLDHGPSLVFYVAGNDVLKGDMLGGFELSLAGVLERDKLVTRIAKDLGAAMVVTLGGGYSRMGWQASASFLSWLLTGLAMRPSAGKGELLRHYEKVARSLDPAALQQGGDELGLTMEDIMGDLSGSPRQDRFLGFYSVQGIELAVERYGLMASIRELGFEDLRLKIDPRDPSRQIISLQARPKGKDGPPLLLVEVVLKRRKVALPNTKAEPLEMLSLEWLLLQDPTSSFSLEKPKLPGQTHPGLGLSREVLGLLVQVCRRIGLHGIVNRPGYYHIAILTSFDMRFLDPVAQGRFLAMRKVLEGWDLAEATALVDADRLCMSDGQRLSWVPADFVLPVSDRLRRWLDSEEYERASSLERERLLARDPHVG